MGHRSTTKGLKKLLLSTLDGRNVRKMTFQVAKVSKALGSVSQMVDGGNRVIFHTDAKGRDISCIENKQTGERIWLRRETRHSMFSTCSWARRVKQ